MLTLPLKSSTLMLLLAVFSAMVSLEGGALAQGGGAVIHANALPISAQDAADMKTIRERLVEAQIPVGTEAVKALQESAMQSRDTLGADGKWPGFLYEDARLAEWGPAQHLDKVLTMVRAYATPGQGLYRDATLLKKIKVGLDTFFAGNYVSGNWWYNDIGVPIKIGPILLMLGEEISEERKQKGLALLKRSADDKPMRGATGANLSWLARVQLMRGLLLPSPALVNESFDALWSELKISPQKADGIQADFSFHQHGPLIYNGGYGQSFINDAVAFLAYAHGTRFVPTVEKEQILVGLLLDGQDWMSRGNSFDAAVRGRNISRQESGSGGNWRQVATTLAGLTTVRHGELLEMARRLEKNGAPLVGNRNFFDSDFMVQQRRGYYVSVRTHSTRTRNTDGSSKSGSPINREGRRSHHVADGATTILRHGDEYRGIAPVWNWQLIPGTTAAQVPALDEERVAFLGGSSFVGGVSDGMYGAATMELERAGLSARKSWFFFDDEFVALGAGISNSSGNPVVTAVNQSLLRGEVRVSGQAAPMSEGDHAETGARWVLHDGMGTIFPANAAVEVANKVQSGRWSDIGTGSEELVSKPVFTLALNHGVRPDKASYEYIVVPDADAAQLDARIGRPAVETLSNTPDLQAVRHKELKILEAVFYRAGRIEGGPEWRVGVDEPCMVMVREKDGGVEVTVSNPENKALAVNVELDRALVGEGASVRGTGTVLHFELPGGLKAGSSVVRFFKRG